MLADHTVKPLECLTRLVAEDDFINHWLQASFRLDLIPRDNRLTRFDAGTGLTGRSSIGKVLQQLGQLAWRQPLHSAATAAGTIAATPFTVFGDVHDLATCGLMSRRCHPWNGLDRQVALDLWPPLAALRAYIPHGGDWLHDTGPARRDRQAVPPRASASIAVAKDMSWVHVVAKTWTHLLAEAAGQPIDPGTRIPARWRDYVARRTGLTAPERMTEGPRGVRAVRVRLRPRRSGRSGDHGRPQRGSPWNGLMPV